VKNAHLRFGSLTYTRVFKKTSTRFKLPLDRFVGESELGADIKAHLISVVGGDTQIAALRAAITNGDRFTIEDTDQTSFLVSLGTKAECYRGSIQLEGHRTLRHLVAASEEFAETAAGTDTERTIIFHDSPQFLWASLASVHGLPGRPEWADWIVHELKRMNAIRSLIGVGCSPVLVTGSKGLFMNSISRGLREGKLGFPDRNGPVKWNRVTLAQLLEVGITG
jgi:hypothetical protein